MFAATVLSSSFINYFVSQASINSINLQIETLTLHNYKLQTKLQKSESDLEKYIYIFEEMKKQF